MSSLTDKTNIQWFPGHMTKTLRMVEKEIKNIDVILMLLDARIPFSSINPELEKYAKMKPTLYVLNKADLADEKITKEWISYFQSENTAAVAINSKNKSSVQHIQKDIDDKLAALYAHHATRGMVGAKIRVMVCGIPNVGKSTFINTFVGSSRAKAANKPGVTRGKQWITTSKFDFLDIPGVLWPKFENKEIATNLAFIGSIKDNVLDIEEISATLLCEVKEHYSSSLMERFKLNETDLDVDNGYALLETIARKRGMLISGGEADLERAATMVLGEFRASKLGRISLERPPIHE